MPSDGLSWFFCCLNPAERAVMRATCEGLVLTLFAGIPFALWDAFWLATTHNEDDYKTAFLHLYHLETVTVELELVPTLVVRPVDGFWSLWVENAFFVALPGAACLDGCQLSRVHEY